MNKAAIEKTAELIDRMDKQLRRRLTEKQLFENTHIAKQIERREQGEVFTLTDHIRGMVYAMLSSGIPWKKVEGGIDERTGKIPALDEIYIDAAAVDVSTLTPGNPPDDFWGKLVWNEMYGKKPLEIQFFKNIGDILRRMAQTSDVPVRLELPERKSSDEASHFIFSVIIEG